MVATRSKVSLVDIPVATLELDSAQRVRRPTAAPIIAPAPALAPVTRGIGRARVRGRAGRGRCRGGSSAPAVVGAHPPAPAQCTNCDFLRRRITRRDATIADLTARIDRRNTIIAALKAKVARKEALIAVKADVNASLQRRFVAESESFDNANAEIRRLGGTEVERVELASAVERSEGEEEVEEAGEAGRDGEDEEAEEA